MTVFHMCSCFSRKSENPLDKVLLTTSQFKDHSVSIRAFNRHRKLKTKYEKECKASDGELFISIPIILMISMDLSTLVFRDFVVQLWGYNDFNGLLFQFITRFYTYKNYFTNCLYYRQKMCLRDIFNILCKF